MGDAPYWFPVLTLVLGAVGGYAADWLRETRGANREAAAARAAFQRETLLELQDWILKLSRAAAAIHHRDEMEYHESRKWGRQQLPDEWSEGFREATANCHRHRVRVLEDSLRKATSEFISTCVTATQGAARDQDDAEARALANKAFVALADELMELQEAIGKQLRELT